MADEPKRDDDYPSWIDTATSVLGAVGFNRVRIQWKLRRWVNERRAARNRRAQMLDHVTYAHRVCAECGAINDRDDKMCARCREKLQARPVEVAGRLGLHAPTGTTTLVAIALVVVFVRTALATGSAAPMDISPLVLIEHGGRLGAAMDAEWWRAATSVLLHTGLFHLGFNLLALFTAGPMLEEQYGKWLLPPIFFATAVAASIFSDAVSGSAIVTVGASGGIMGVIGCLAGIGHRIALDGPRRGRTLRNEMLLWSLFVIFFGFVVGADQWAHLGGFVAGAAIGLVVRPTWVRAGAGRRIAGLVGALGLAALAATTWAALIPLTELPPSLRAPDPSLPEVAGDLAVDDGWPTDDPDDLDDLGTQVSICRTVSAGDRAKLDELWDAATIDALCAELAQRRAACAGTPAPEDCAELRRVDAWFDAREP